ncbi:MAG: EthD family reductase [Polaromonas sp.]|uniref:EthD family reductase n=1 Tax=Polaromonas sp. TaxID=1869339 RepID=UPI002733D31B|nr:EthD family reductase [Polaromonas sp.]MDP3795645.1 EthD family reductase [Polaromonas sp.]
MIKVSVLYPNDEGARFDMTYYVDRHMTMVKRVLGEAMIRCEIDEGLSGATPGSRPIYRAAVHMYFESTEAFYAAFGPHAKDITKDVPNYTNVRPVTQIATVHSG